jgi:outer membrane immunogenic protein
MKRLLAGLTVSVLITPAVAADMATPYLKAPLPPVWSWTGLYVGAYAGGTYGNTNMSLIPGAGELAFAPGAVSSTNISHNGFVGGALVGYNFQLPSSFVLGGEFEFGGNSTSGSGTTVSGAPGFLPTTNNFDQSWDLRARARLGLANGPFLPFIAGGLSVTRADLDLLFICPGLGTFIADSSKTLTGFNVGAGFDYAVSQHVTARLEYIFDDYGSHTIAEDGTQGWNDRSLSSFMNHTVRAAVAYRF